MPLNKKNIPINFSLGLDLKTDPKQLSMGNFLVLENSIFQKGKLLTKRNGFGQLSSLPDSTFSFLTTFNSNLTAVGDSLAAYSQGSMSWVDKGFIAPLQLDVLPLIRSNTSQTQVDIAIGENGTTCVVFTDNVPVAGSNTLKYKYAVVDSVTGQNLVAPALITSTGTITYAPRVFYLGKYFIIVFDSVITAVNHLQYVAVNSTTLAVSAAVDISSSYTPASTGSFDGIVANNNLYIAWNGADAANAIRITYIDTTLAQHNTKVFTPLAVDATLITLCADTTPVTPNIYIAWWGSGNSNSYMAVVDQNLVTITAPIKIIDNDPIVNQTIVAKNDIMTIFVEETTGATNNFVYYGTFTIAGAPIVALAILNRTVGLASKAFIIDDEIYFLGIFVSSYQPTYFLLNHTNQVIAKLAYSNGGGAVVTGLSSVSVDDDGVIRFPYLFKDLITSVNKDQGVVNTAGIYSQTGLNMAVITLGTEGLNSAEIGTNLHLSGGFLWMYDGYVAVEHGFHLWPDVVTTVVSHSGGSMIVQDYYYQAVYEWTDAQGNIFRSAPSIPVKAASADFSGSSNSVTVTVSALAFTYKLANPIKVVIYRWSTAQQNYYQCTSTAIPVLNDPTVSSTVSFIDTHTDASILGNALIYTTGGVVENIGAPSVSVMALFKSRLFLITAENKNLAWYSKQVIQGVPAEFSDLFTQYIAPTVGQQGSSGPTECIYPMDDKIIFFKKDSIYYMVGNGPDNTGANNDFSDPIFITTTIGCDNQNSILLIPQGLIFQSDKGIWLLGRDLSTNYIGAPVEDFNSNTVLSVVSIPGTNQVRFTLENRVTLFYDYFFGQWGTFTQIASLSSAIYQSLHTFINSYGQVFQETPGLYLDGSLPVLMKFTTAWINLAGLQGFQRAYEFSFLGNYISPHKLKVDIAYDYSPSPSQSNIILPTNYSGVYGSDTIYGGSVGYGGNPSLEQWRVGFQRQKCQAFQITVSEYFDSSFGTVAGEGLTMSGLDLTVGLKSGRPILPASKQVG